MKGTICFCIGVLKTEEDRTLRGSWIFGKNIGILTIRAVTIVNN